MNDYRWKEQVELALRKFAGHVSTEERKDLRQDCYLALIKAGDKVDNPAFAYDVAKKRILRVLQDERKVVTGQSLSDPDILYRSELEHNYTLDMPTKLDAELASESVKTLNPIEQAVVRSFFGIDCKKKTENEIAEELGLKRRRVKTIRDSAIRKLRRLFIKLERN